MPGLVCIVTLSPVHTEATYLHTAIFYVEEYWYTLSREYIGPEPAAPTEPKKKQTADFIYECMHLIEIRFGLVFNRSSMFEFFNRKFVGPASSCLRDYNIYIKF